MIDFADASHFRPQSSRSDAVRHYENRGNSLDIRQRFCCSAAMKLPQLPSFSRMSSADKIYYGIVTWGLLRCDSLTKLINVNRKQFEKALYSKRPPVENAGHLACGQQIQTSCGKESPCARLRGDFFARKSGYTPKIPLPFALTETGKNLQKGPPPKFEINGDDSDGAVETGGIGSADSEIAASRGEKRPRMLCLLPRSNCEDPSRPP